MRSAVPLSLLLASTLSLAAEAPPCEPQARMVTEFGTHQAWPLRLAPKQEQEIAPEGEIRYMRILIKRPPELDDTWRITVRDAAGRPLQTLSSRHVSPDSMIWTDRLLTGKAIIRADASGATGHAAETVKVVAVMKDAVRPYYSKQGTIPAWIDLYDNTVPSLMKRTGESVGMFVGNEGNTIDGISLWTCSGFIISNAPAVLFVTNDHCGGNWADASGRWTGTICKNAFVDFSWDNDTVSRDYACDAVAARSPENDLVVLRLQPLRSDAPPPPLVLRRARPLDEPIFVIHHPAADAKMVSRGCTGFTQGVTSTPTVDLAREFAHRCDTESGSSGAPTFDASGRVVGIHHLGFQKMAPDQCDRLNKAVYVDRLLELLTANPELTGYHTE